MILTGKAKEDFENYVLNKNLGHDSEVLISVYNQETLFINYNNVKETLLNALIIEWFDSIGNLNHNGSVYSFKTLYLSTFKQLEKKHSISDIQKIAIKKANEIYNEKSRKQITNFMR